MDKLSSEEVKQKLAGVDGWRIEGDSLKKDLKFAGFSEAMEFMNKLAVEAEKMSHHPDWSNSYNKISISLTTHSAGGITNNDFKLAQQADQIARGI